MSPRPVATLWFCSLLIAGGALATPARADLLVSNLNEATESSFRLGFDAGQNLTFWGSIDFTTDGFNYSLDSITMLLRGTANTSGVFGRIYDDGGGDPGNQIGDLITPAMPGNGVEALVNFDANGVIQLDANTRYWVVLGAQGGAIDWMATSSNNQSGKAGATIGDITHLTSDGGASWNEDIFFKVKLAVNASVPEPGTFGFLAVLGSAAAVSAWRRRRVKTRAQSTRAI